MRLTMAASNPVRAALPLLKRRVAFAGSPFRAQLRQYGYHRCSLFQNALLVGIAANNGLCRSVRSLTTTPKSIGFMSGPAQVELISAFLNSPEAQRVQHLQIGTTPHDAADINGAHMQGLSAVLALFKGQRLPRLKSLSLGDCFLFGCTGAVTENAPNMPGCILGDITPLFEAAPRLEILDLNGPFHLSRPIRHFRLREITIQLDPSLTADAALTQDSLNNLLMSDMPLIEALSLHCADDDVVALDLPHGYDPKIGMPKLTEMVLENLSAESAKRQSALQARLLAR